jgi:hypothetical protein
MVPKTKKVIAIKGEEPPKPTGALRQQNLRQAEATCSEGRLSKWLRKTQDLDELQKLTSALSSLLNSLENQEDEDLSRSH